MESNSHPLLRGGRRETKYSHGFPPSEMEALSSICEAFLPPLPLGSLEIPERCDLDAQAVEHFHKACGSQYPVPDEVNIFLISSFMVTGISIADKTGNSVDFWVSDRVLTIAVKHALLWVVP